ncbi:DUF5946 family protein [Solicola gregarius]|uniref:DUF5946 family protein n=1 Tax=Solicola gregarius TaxID=2908642 RepID=A0AA46YJG5_9ACTN|nr:DUF5946 family protein [Solicola gregarius]UYM03554.1 DUF5946 family protein [Solicola gregarius]
MRSYETSVPSYGDAMEFEACGECGATGRWGTCEQLFHVLLALDHERRQPWAAYHSVNVACYLLQHPSLASREVLAGQWSIVAIFVDEGLEAVHTLTARAVRRNNCRASGRAEIVGRPAPQAVRPVGATIEDVSVDGSFPATGYEGRIRLWADATATARAS